MVTKEQMCSQTTMSIKHTYITHMNDWSEKTLVIEPMCLLLRPSLKIPPCLIRTHPPHLRYVCHWLRPKVFKLGRIGCAPLHTEAHERDDLSFFRGYVERCCTNEKLNMYFKYKVMGSNLFPQCYWVITIFLYLLRWPGIDEVYLNHPLPLFFPLVSTDCLKK